MCAVAQQRERGRESSDVGITVIVWSGNAKRLQASQHEEYQPSDLSSVAQVECTPLADSHPIYTRPSRTASHDRDRAESEYCGPVLG